MRKRKSVVKPPAGHIKKTIRDGVVIFVRPIYRDEVTEIHGAVKKEAEDTKGDAPLDEAESQRLNVIAYAASLGFVWCDPILEIEAQPPPAIESPGWYAYGLEVYKEIRAERLLTAPDIVDAASAALLGGDPAKGADPLVALSSLLRGLTERP